MLNTALILLLAGSAAGGTVVAVDGVRRKRSARRREERHQELRIFARRRGLSALEDVVPDHVIDRATPRYARKRAGVEDVMLGRDERGNYYVLRRRHAGRTQQVLAFDLPYDSHIDGFTVESYLRSRGLSPLQKWMRRKVEARPQVRSSWDCEARAMLDEGSVERCGRLVQVIARESVVQGAVPLSLDLDGRRVLIRSQGPYDFEALANFLDAALTLRSEILNTLSERVRGYSAEIRPIAEAVRSVAERTLARAREARARERAERQSGPWSTVMDVPPELRRSRPAPQEVEEEEVEVIVYTGSGRPL